MKKTIPTIVLIIFCIVFSNAQVASLTIGTNTMGVSFMDTTLPLTYKNKIITDLQNCVNNPWGERVKINRRNEAEFPKYLSFHSLNTCYYGDIEFPKNISTNDVGDMFLYVPQKLSDAYTNAFEFAGANSNAVAAAYDFISLISSDTFLNTTSSNQIHNYVFIKEVTTNEMYALGFDEIWPIYFQYPKYYTPSILGFFYSNDGPEATNLWLQIPVSLSAAPRVSSYSWLTYTAIWHENKWKICTWNDPYD